IGAHPKAPSRLSDGRSLLDVIVADPAGMLGVDVQSRFGARLPFLLKVLAVDAPLSLQAHPNLEQAARGFAREQQAGVPLDAAERTYKDDNHKPELLCALTPFEALSGFRPPAQTAELFESLGVSSLDIARELRAPDAGALQRSFTLLMTLPSDVRARVIEDVLARCERTNAQSPGPFAGSIGWALKLGALYPGDIGVVASLLLNHLSLEPLDAVYLEAGRLHAYLSGTGVEIMANSDNVLRGGLTPKHVDVAELSNVLVFDSPPIGPSPVRQLASGELRYETPAPEFQLSRLELGPDVRFRNEPRGPEILLCVEGQATIELAAPAPAAPRPLRRGQACFLSASSPGYTLSGSGRVFRAMVGASPG
ncbi:MAG TPA: mannose-6-phosphate isomerase, class I, partial [Polyangiaceae bacterium]|nr:mannose-6-phosphate isomerase, class I [Polyangiaceae bacterium]